MVHYPDIIQNYSQNSKKRSFPRAQQQNLLVKKSISGHKKDNGFFLSCGLHLIFGWQTLLMSKTSTSVAQLGKKSTSFRQGAAMCC